MSHISRFVLCLFLFGGLALSALAAPPPTAQGQSDLSPACAFLNDNALLDMAYLNMFFPFLRFYAGEVITLRANNIRTEGEIFARLNDAPTNQHLSVQTSCPGTLTLTVTADTQRASLRWGATNVVFTPQWDVSCAAAPLPPQPAPGPDMFADLTDAAMGRFLHDTPAYWAPDASLPPSATLPAGQTAWVLGMDASGQFYKIVWSANALWVPAEAMGPLTGDPLWDGVPLPTGVVP